MEQEQIGNGYFRFNLPTSPNSTEVSRIDEIFQKALSSTVDDLRIVERFEPSPSFWSMYSDCLSEYDLDETASDPIVYCKGEDAEFLYAMLGAFRKAMKEIPRSSVSAAVRRFLPALVNAHLRATISPEHLRTKEQYEKAQSKDTARELTNPQV
jgi:hypothetical protein